MFGRDVSEVFGPVRGNQAGISGNNLYCNALYSCLRIAYSAGWAARIRISSAAVPELRFWKEDNGPLARQSTCLARISSSFLTPPISDGAHLGGSHGGAREFRRDRARHRRRQRKGVAPDSIRLAGFNLRCRSPGGTSTYQSTRCPRLMQFCGGGRRRRMRCAAQGVAIKEIYRLTQAIPNLTPSPKRASQHQQQQHAVCAQAYGHAARAHGAPHRGAIGGVTRDWGPTPGAPMDPLRIPAGVRCSTGAVPARHEIPVKAAGRPTVGGGGDTAHAKARSLGTAWNDSTPPQHCSAAYRAARENGQATGSDRPTPTQRVLAPGRALRVTAACSPALHRARRLALVHESGGGYHVPHACQCYHSTDATSPSTLQAAYSAARSPALWAGLRIYVFTKFMRPFVKAVRERGIRTFSALHISTIFSSRFVRSYGGGRRPLARPAAARPRPATELTRPRAFGCRPSAWSTFA